MRDVAEPPRAGTDKPALTDRAGMESRPPRKRGEGRAREGESELPRRGNERTAVRPGSAGGEITPAARILLDTLRSRGFDFFCGVADSTIASLISELGSDYISATREDLAVGMASGAYLSGRRPVVLMQNSGLGYCLNGLTSLNLIYKIPLLLIVGYRGWQGRDAPEHWVMGAHCEQLLREVGIPVFVPEAGQAPGAVEQAAEALRRGKIPAAIFIRPGVLG